MAIFYCSQLVGWAITLLVDNVISKPKPDYQRLESISSFLSLDDMLSFGASRWRSVLASQVTVNQDSMGLDGTQSIRTKSLTQYRLWMTAACKRIARTVSVWSVSTWMSTYPLVLGSKFGRSLSWSCDSIGRSSVLQRSDKRSSLYLPRMPLQSRAVIGNEKQEQWFAQLSFISGKNLTTRTDKAEGRRAPRQNSLKKCHANQIRKPNHGQYVADTEGEAIVLRPMQIIATLVSHPLTCCGKCHSGWTEDRFFSSLSPTTTAATGGRICGHKNQLFLQRIHFFFLEKVHENSIIPDRLI